jgi:hypothetical protein
VLYQNPRCEGCSHGTGDERNTDERNDDPIACPTPTCTLPDAIRKVRSPRISYIPNYKGRPPYTPNTIRSMVISSHIYKYVSTQIHSITKLHHQEVVCTRVSEGEVTGTRWVHVTRCSEVIQGKSPALHPLRSMGGRYE